MPLSRVIAVPGEASDELKNFGDRGAGQKAIERYDLRSVFIDTVLSVPLIGRPRIKNRVGYVASTPKATMGRDTSGDVAVNRQRIRCDCRPDIDDGESVSEAESIELIASEGTVDAGDDHVDVSK